MAVARRASQPARDGARRRLRSASLAPASTSAPQAYNGAVREQLAELQRGRILTAMFDVCDERGAANVTVAHVVARAGVSRRTFYELFDDREDCLLAAFEQGLAYVSERVLPAYESQKAWRERVRAALVELLAFLDSERVIGNLLIVDSQAGGPRTRERRAEVIAALTKAIDEGHTEAKAASPAPLTAEGVVGGVLAVIHSRLTARDNEPLVELANALMSMIVLPYLGTAAAKRELERNVTASRQWPKHENPQLLSDPFKQAGMRLTYRTVRVLTAVADHQGASNRVIGQVAGITDQGQISKLLARLQHAGLVSNTGIGPGQGAPNAWKLTEKGQAIAQSVRLHSPDQEREAR